jgi:hypothetical protein
MGVEPNHTTARKPGLYKSFNPLWAERWRLIKLSLLETSKLIISAILLISPAYCIYLEWTVFLCSSVLRMHIKILEEVFLIFNW